MSHPRTRPGAAAASKFRPRGYPLFLFFLVVGTSLFVAAGIWGLIEFWSSQIPDVRILRTQYPSVVPQRPQSRDRRMVQKFQILWSAKRPDSWVALSSVSPTAVGAIVVSEDWAFFSHRGYDSNQIREALKHDLEQGSFARGASTITQQVAKNVFLTQEKSLWRKAKELLLAIRMDKELGKRKVLETYLNIVEWGPGIFGIRAASAAYFSKGPSELTAREGAFLAMLLPSPVRYSQSFRQKKLTGYARSTMDRIIEKMVRAGYLTPEEADVARAERMAFEGAEPDVGEENSGESSVGAGGGRESESQDAPVEEAPFPDLVEDAEDSAESE